MSEDRLLRELGHLAKEEEAAEKARLDERWDRLSRDELTAGEEAELLALAATSVEAREAYEAFRPLGPDFQADVLRKIRERGPAPVTEVPVAPVAPRLQPPKPPPFRWRPAVIGSLAAAAAAVAVTVRVVLLPAPLPEYASLDLTGNAVTMRGTEPAPAEVKTFAPGDRFQAILSPRTAASHERRLEAECFLACDREVSLLAARSDIQPNGAVKMEGAIGGDVRPGVCTLWAVVGRRGKLPDAAGLRSHARGVPIRQPDWEAMPEPIRIQPRGL